MIEPGSPAPEFTLPDQDGNKVSLADYRGRTVVLVFYPADFSRVCTDQLSVYQEVLPQLEEAGAELVGISVDGAFCHKAFQEHQGLTIPLLADFHPKGDVSQKYGVWKEDKGICERAIVIVDKQGIVRYIDVHDISEAPENAQLLEVLRELD